MRVASISGIKNESDIIESFVRQNANYIDDFYFIDDSADKTPEILKNLAAEGFKIFTIKLDTRDYQHSKIMTSATRMVGQSHQYDWIFYLDADEIIYYSNREQFHQHLAAHKNVEMGVTHHFEMAPNGKDYFSSLNPLKECFNVRSTQSLTRKIFIRGDVATRTMVGPGQHDAISVDGQRFSQFESDLKLAHFPVRSATQYATRTIIIYTSLIAKLNKIPNEGHHAVRQYEWLKEHNFVVPDSMVTAWGLQFGLDESERHLCTLTSDTPHQLADIQCKYHALAVTPATLLLANELERVAKLLSDFRHKTHDTIQNLSSLF